MKITLKTVVIGLGAVVVGGFMGWCFNLAGYETSVSVAVILAIFASCESLLKKKKIATK